LDLRDVFNRSSIRLDLANVVIKQTTSGKSDGARILLDGSEQIPRRTLPWKVSAANAGTLKSKASARLAQQNDNPLYRIGFSFGCKIMSVNV
jgi:hypothetical protein